MVRGLLHLAEHVRAEEHGLPGGLRVAEHAVELLLHERVEPAGRLVEHEQLGLVHERLDESELLLVALRQAARPLGEVEAEPVGELLRRAASHRSRDLGVVGEQVTPAHPALEVQLAGEVADAAAQRRSAGPRRFAEHADLARGRDG